MSRCTVLPSAKVKVIGTVCAGNRSEVRPLSVMLGPSLPKPTCTDWPAGIAIGVLAGALAELLADAVVEPLAPAGALLLGLPVAVAEDDPAEAALLELDVLV